MVYDMEKRTALASMPTGIIGQISFDRLINQMRVAGEIREDETVTHLDVRPNEGVIRYRVTYCQPR